MTTNYIEFPIRYIKSYILLIIVFLFSGLFFNIQAQVNLNPAEDNFKIMEPFSNIPWGAERSDFLDLISQDSQLQIEDIKSNKVTVSYKRATYIYGFNEKGLYQSMFIAKLVHGDNSYKKYVTAMTKIYGKPEIDDGAYIWEHGILGVMIQVKNGTLFFSYMNIELKDNESDSSP